MRRGCTSSLAASTPLLLGSTLLLVGCLVGCGASTHARSTTTTTSSSTTTATLPTITDEWLRYPPRSADAVPPTSAPTEITERALESLPLLHAAAYRRLMAVGYPALEGAELREVEIEVDYIGEPLRPEQRLALIVPAEDGGAPWAFDGAWRPVLALGPEHDLVAACQERAALRRRQVDASNATTLAARRRDEERDDPSGPQTPDVEAFTPSDAQRLERAFAACPWFESSLPLATRGRGDLVQAPSEERTTVPGLVISLAVQWAHMLATQVQSGFLRGRDASARHHASLLRRVFPLGFGPGRIEDEMPTTWAVLVDLDRRAARSRGSRSWSTVQSLIDQLEDVAVDQRNLHPRRLYTPSDDGSFENRRYDVMARDETVRALVAMGAAAIEALSECVRGDARLSRSFRWGIDYTFRSPQSVPVSELCSLALYGEDFYSWPHGERGVRIIEVNSRDVAALLARDDAELDQLVSASAWMVDDPDGAGPSPRNLELLRGSEDDRIARVLAGRARAARLTSQESTERDRDFETGRDGFCSLALAALMWSEESAMWVVDDAIAAVEEGWSCDRELALALRDRRPDLVARRARRVPWDDLLAE